MRRPDFFIVGAPKCGTTAMYSYLKQHPEVFMSEIKEPSFFGTDLHKNYPWFRTEVEYLACFAEAANEKRAGEASTCYFYSKRAAQEIREFNPCASIIIMLRNPVDMIRSFHSQQLYQGDEDIADFEAALEAEEKRKRGLCLPATAGTLEGLFYRELAKVAEHVQRYVDIFGCENVHIILFDDLKRDTAMVYRETLSFLGVTADFQSELPIVNPNKQARSQTAQKFLVHPPSIVRRFGCATMPRRLRQRLFVGLWRLNTRYGPRSAMTPELRRRLQGEFAPEVERLGKLLDRDLSYWNKD
jgi:hypothetical protein